MTKKQDIYSEMTFEQLVDFIRDINSRMATQAGRAVNISLTLRNWFIGLYIEEFELHGKDRATYGEKLLSELSKRLSNLQISNCSHRQLYKYLQFHRVYPQILGTLSPKLKTLVPPEAENRKLGTVSSKLTIPVDDLISRLSYSQFELLADIDDDLKRLFYEVESIRGNWSVRELKRQISSLYFERSGLSKNKE